MSIPYFTVEPWSVCGVRVSAYQVALSVAVVVPTVIGIVRAVRLGRALLECVGFALALIVGGFVGAHVFEWAAYRPAQVWMHPALLLRAGGWSSMGAYLGVAGGAFAWKYLELHERRVGPLFVVLVRRRASARPLLPMLDHFFAVACMHQALGRVGCALAHDHPGIVVSRHDWLAVEFGQGPEERWGPLRLVHGSTPRLDMGLVELVWISALAAFVVTLWRRRLPDGALVTVVILCHAPVRFMLDFLRMPESEGGDARFGGLTPAQWGCLFFFAVGLALARHVFRGAGPRAERMVPA